MERNTSQYLSIHSLFKSISNNFISLFVPLIILQQMGYKMSLIYVIILSFSTVLGILIFYKLIIKNPVLAICIHIIFSLTSYIIIALFKINLTVIILNAITTGLGQSLYHSSIFSIISSNKSKAGFSNYQIFTFIGSIAMILFNGYILNINESFSVLLTWIISLIIYIISLIPFFIIKNKIIIKDCDTTKFINIVKQTKHFNIFHTAFGLQDVIASIIIPIFLAMNDMSIKVITIILVIINIAKIFITMLSNFMYKKNQSFLMVLIGSILFSISCTLLPNIMNKTFVYILSVLISISFPLFFISDCNKYAEKTSNFSHKAMIIREIFVHGMRPFFLLPFIFISNISILIYMGVILAIILTISFYFISKHY